MRIRFDINEVNAMADTLIAAAETIAEIGTDVGVNDLPAEVAAMFEHGSATMRVNFENLATAYKREAVALKLRALIAQFDVNKAVAIYPPPPPPAPVFAAQPAAANGGSGYNPSKYYIPGSAGYNRLTAQEKKMNNSIAQMIVMPMVMNNYNNSMDRLQQSIGAQFEDSFTGVWNKTGKRPTDADMKWFAPNTYKLSH